MSYVPDDHVWSPSQIDTGNLCLRKWGWTKLEKLPEGDKPSAIIGTEVHRLLEIYHVTGQAPDATKSLTVPGGRPGAKPRTVYPGQIAHKGLHLLPPQGSCKPERKFTVDIGGHKFRGSVDLYRGTLNPSLVVDYKNTGNKKYAKDRAYLRNQDPQSAVYSSFAVAEGARKVDLQWIYFPTVSGQAFVTQLDLTVPDVLDMQGRVIRSTDIMARARDDYRSGKIGVLDLPPTPSACSAYGGCDFVDKCNLTSGQKIVGLFRKERDKMSLRDLLAAKNAANASGGSTPAQTTTPAPSGGGLAALKKAAASAAPATSAVSDEYSEMDRDALKNQAMKRGLVDKSSKLGEESLRALLRENPGTEPESDSEGDGSDNYDDMEISELQNIAVKREMYGTHTVLSIKRSKLIGDLREYDANPPAPEPEPEPEPAPVVASKGVSKPPKEAPTPAGERLTVYVGCVPVGVPVINAAEILDIANELVCKEEKVSHYTQVQGFPPSVLAQALREIMPNVKGAVVVERGTLGPILDEFVRAADLVVRGT